MRACMRCRRELSILLCGRLISRIGCWRRWRRGVLAALLAKHQSKQCSIFCQMEDCKCGQPIECCHGHFSPLLQAHLGSGGVHLPCATSLLDVSNELAGLAPEGIEQFYLSGMNTCFCRFGFDFFPRMFPRFILPIPWAKGTRTGDGQCGFFSGRFESLG